MDQMGLSIPFVGSDNFVGSQMIGEYVKNKLEGRGRVLVIEGIVGVENAELRKKGFIEAVKKNSSIEIVASKSANWNTEEALSVAYDLLNTHKDIDAIFCANDSMALGALQAIDLLGLSKKILIAGYDNIESVRTEIRNGSIKATIEQHPELMGQYGVELAWEQLKGMKIPSYKSTPLDLITFETFNKKVAVLISTIQNPFFSTLIEGAKAASDLFGMELIVFDAKNEDARQLTDISNALSQKVDLIILNPTNSESIYPGIELANSKGTPVITVDRKVSGGKVLCHIASDNIQGGRMAAQFMAQSLEEKGEILELEGISGTSTAYERGFGFNEALGKFSKIHVASREVANFDRKEAESVMLRYIRQNTYFDGVFAHNDNMILGVIDAYEVSGVKLPKVLIGFDGIAEARTSIKDNKLTATIEQKPRTMGKVSIEIAASYFRKEKISSNKSIELALIKQ
jgi:ribose transport system substrate-binding protein